MMKGVTNTGMKRVLNMALTEHRI